MKLDCAANMQLTFSLNVSGVREFFGWEQANSSRFAIRSDSRLPLAIFFGDAKHAAADIVRLGTSLIGVVGLPCDITQICKTVIGFVKINVVDCVYRPFASNVEPCEPVRVLQATSDSYRNVADLAFASCRSSEKAIHFELANPRKLSGFSVVVKEFAQKFCGKIGSSHAVVPLKQWFGQRPARVDSTSGLRHFNMLED